MQTRKINLNISDFDIEHLIGKGSVSSVFSGEIKLSKNNRKVS
jgi:hypothetical protein